MGYVGITELKPPSSRGLPSQGHHHHQYSNYSQAHGMHRNVREASSDLSSIRQESTIITLYNWGQP